MATAVVIDDTLTIPGCDGLAGFRGWTRSPGFPSTGRIDWIAGSIEVDMSPENLFTHGTLKTEIAAKIYARVRAADLVVEILSDSSASKDTRRLPEAYAMRSMEPPCTGTAYPRS